MFTIGAHLSIARGFLTMGQHALDIGANTLAFFTRNPRGGNARPIAARDVMAFRALMAANGFGPVVGHASYTLNAASDSARLRIYAMETFADDMARMAHLPGCLYNFHPGSHVGQGTAQGVLLIAGMLNTVLTPAQHNTILLETMCGKGSEIGGRFEELRAILDLVALEDKVGVCLDTCHVWDAGYDIAGDLDGVLTAFDRTVGLARLHAVHLNDSKNARGSRLDRHARLGEGTIGLEAIFRIINHPALRHLPFILETPNDLDGWAKEIALLKDHYAV